MQNRLCLVQFIHPGGEHRPDIGLSKHWNRDSHKRKFVTQPGRYVSGGGIQDGPIAFWAEWEPESTVVAQIGRPLPNGPKYIYEPFYVMPQSYRGLQNTDPFVFGEVFHYTGCQQRTKSHPTQLRYLERGSVILFGSCMEKNRFVLDTVFVVDRWVDHHRGSYEPVLANVVSQEYIDVTINPWYRQSDGHSSTCAPVNAADSWRLYFGATYEQPVGEMFSFFPCTPFESKSLGFPRPVLTLRDTITDNLTQGKRITRFESIKEMERAWNVVVAQVQEQGLALGIYAAMPPRIVQ
jgi:hypothetical protein